MKIHRLPTSRRPIAGGFGFSPMYHWLVRWLTFS